MCPMLLGRDGGEYIAYYENNLLRFHGVSLYYFYVFIKNHYYICIYKYAHRDMLLLQLSIFSL